MIPYQSLIYIFVISAPGTRLPGSSTASVLVTVLSQAPGPQGGSVAAHGRKAHTWPRWAGGPQMVLKRENRVQEAMEM